MRCALMQALIVPVIHRGLRDRTGDTKKRAARIAGNMASLVNEPKVRAHGYGGLGLAPLFPQPQLRSLLFWDTSFRAGTADPKL